MLSRMSVDFANSLRKNIGPISFHVLYMSLKEGRIRMISHSLKRWTVVYFLFDDDTPLKS